MTQNSFMSRAPAINLAFMRQKGFLVRIKKTLLLLSTLALIASVIDFVTKGIGVTSLFTFGLSSIMYNFANRCDNILLRIKIENMIESKLGEINDD